MTPAPAKLLLEERTADLAGTERLAAKIFAEYLHPRRLTLLFLEGELGAGKTAFVRSLGTSLGVAGLINSPTFNLLNIYEGKVCDLYHYDLYRLSTPAELEQLDFADRWAGRFRDAAVGADRPQLHAVEWWERGRDYYPSADTVPIFRLHVSIDDAHGAGSGQYDFDEEGRVFAFYGT